MMCPCKSHKLNERRVICLLLAVARKPEGVLQEIPNVFTSLPFVSDVSVLGVYLPFSQAEDNEVFMKSVKLNAKRERCKMPFSRFQCFQPLI